MAIVHLTPWHESQRQGASPRRADLHDRMRLEHMRLDHRQGIYGIGAPNMVLWFILSEPLYHLNSFDYM